MKKILIPATIAALLVLLCPLARLARADSAALADSSGKAVLRMYLPREKVLKGDYIKLGQIVVPQGDEKLWGKAEAVSLGKFVVAGQKITLNRNTILSRLASSGIDMSKVSLVGAESVVVRRDEEVIGSEKFVEAARAYLQAKYSTALASMIEVKRKLDDWTLPAGVKNVELKARLATYQTGGKTRVTVEAVQGGSVLKKFDVYFVLKYKSSRVVATVDMVPGTVLSPENIAVEMIESNRPGPTGRSVPYGMVARRMIKKGMAITSSVYEPAELPVLVNRRQMVLIKIETPVLLLTNIGEALSDGKVNDFIKVKMGPNRGGRIISARVRPDGTLEPYHKGMKL